MADPRQILLAINKPKKDATVGVGTVAADTVLIEYDLDASNIDVINTLLKCIQILQEDEY